MSTLDLVTRGLAQASSLSIATRGLIVVRELLEQPGVIVGDLRVDVRLVFDVTDLVADIAIVAGDLAVDNTLETAILLSLFSDARATPEELRDFGGLDPRGWWGDELSEVDGDVWGSKLWLLARRVQDAQTLLAAREYAGAALAWLRADGICDDVILEAEYPARGVLALQVEPVRAGMPRERFAFVWEP